MVIFRQNYCQSIHIYITKKGRFTDAEVSNDAKEDIA